jgi:hypothetical protein
MWPDAWTQQEVYDDILSAFVNARFNIPGKDSNYWQGVSARGTTVGGFLIDSKQSHLGVVGDITTAYPVLK